MGISGPLPLWANETKRGKLAVPVTPALLDAELHSESEGWEATLCKLCEAWDRQSMHPPFARRGSGCPTAPRQLSGPGGAAAGSALLHLPHYFEKTSFQDP